MILESTQPLTEMSIRNLPGGKVLPRSVYGLASLDNREPQRLTTLWNSTAYCRESFTSFYLILLLKIFVCDKVLIAFVFSKAVCFHIFSSSLLSNDVFRYYVSAMAATELAGSVGKVSHIWICQFRSVDLGYPLY
jgi:hypothetical protein